MWWKNYRSLLPGSSSLETKDHAGRLQVPSSVKGTVPSLRLLSHRLHSSSRCLLSGLTKVCTRMLRCNRRISTALQWSQCKREALTFCAFPLSSSARVHTAESPHRAQSPCPHEILQKAVHGIQLPFVHRGCLVPHNQPGPAQELCLAGLPLDVAGQRAVAPHNSFVSSEASIVSGSDPARDPTTPRSRIDQLLREGTGHFVRLIVRCGKLNAPE